MTTVTVLAGERTIGGTQVIVEDEGARLLFDCGIAYDPAGNPFAHVRPRPHRVLSDLIRLGLVPAVPGLYAPDLGSEMAGGEAGPLAVALSHSHLDHTHLVGFIAPAVPVYTSPPTARILQVLSETGAMLGTLDRPLTGIEPGQPFTVGPMRVRLIPVDHDVPGACGLLIETSEGIIAYSGDLRLHGAHPERTLQFAQAAREAGTRLLILEGTRLFPVAELSAPVPAQYERVEVDVPAAVRADLTSAARGLGIILLTPENGERVEAIACAAAGVGRLFVLDLEGLAYAVAALGRPLAAPHAVFLPDGATGASPLLPTLQIALQSAPRVVTAPEIAADPGDFLLHLPFERFAGLLDLAGHGCGGVVITSNGLPLGRFDPAWAHLEWWARQLGFTLADAACTGHATPRDLALMAGLSGARVVMPLHSHYPELMPVPPERLLLPERGQSYRLCELGA